MTVQHNTSIHNDDGIPNPNQDNCESCLGTRSGVKGNENVIDGRIVCDYCHADGFYKKVFYGDN